MSIHNSPLTTSLYDVIFKEETNHIIGRITKAYLEGTNILFITHGYHNSGGFSSSFQLSPSHCISTTNV